MAARWCVSGRHSRILSSIQPSLLCTSQLNGISACRVVSIITNMEQRQFLATGTGNYAGKMEIMERKDIRSSNVEQRNNSNNNLYRDNNSKRNLFRENNTNQVCQNMYECKNEDRQKVERIGDIVHEKRINMESKQNETGKDKAGYSIKDNAHNTCIQHNIDISKYDNDNTIYRGKDPGLTSLSLLLHQGKVKQSIGYLGKLRARKTIELPHYSIIITNRNCTIENGYHLLRRLKDDSLTPDITIFIALCRKIPKKPRPLEKGVAMETEIMATVLLACMDHGMVPLVKAYSLVARECAKYSDTATIKRLLVDMHLRNVEPDSQLYHYMLSLYIKVNNMPSTEEILSTMRLSKIPISHMIWSDIIQSLAKKGRGIAAEAMLVIMSHYDCCPSEIDYCYVIQAYANQKSREGAERVLISMNIDQLQPSIKLYEAMLLAYPGGATLEGVSQFMQSMSKYRHALNFKMVRQLALQLADQKLSNQKELVHILNYLRQSTHSAISNSKVGNP